MLLIIRRLRPIHSILPSANIWQSGWLTKLPRSLHQLAQRQFKRATMFNKGNRAL